MNTVTTFKMKRRTQINDVYFACFCMCMCMPWQASAESAVGDMAMAANASADRRVEECRRTLPSLIPEASPEQIANACHDKYSLSGLYVTACLQRVRTTHIAEGSKSILETEENIRNKCSARERIAGITVQPYSQDEKSQDKNNGDLIYTWPAVGKVSVLRQGLFRKIYGIKISANVGDPVLAVADGTITEVGIFRGVLRVVIFHGDGLPLTGYLNLMKVNVVKDQSVTRGQKIGDMAEDPDEKAVGALTFMGQRPTAFTSNLIGTGLYDPLEFLPARD